MDDSSVGAVSSYDFTNVTANHTIAASFAIDTYTLTYTAGANGSISGTSPQTVNYGGSGTAVTAVPNTGYHFVKWSDDSTANPRTDTNVTSNIPVTASFAINTFTLTYTTGANGSISGTSPQTINYGGSGTAVTAVPNTGYHFVKWSDDSTANPRTDTNVTSNIPVTASFAINTYTLTITADSRSKTYGDADPALTYQITSGSLAAGDAFTGAIARVAGENVGTYIIQQGTLALNSNYNLTFVEGTFTIGPKALTIHAHSRSKTYGDTVTFLGTEFTISGLVGSDAVTSVTLTSSGAGASTAVGTYDIIPSAAVGTSLGNYTISYRGSSLTVNKANTGAIVSSLSDPSTSGQSVTFTATVTGTGAPGTVTFKDGETVLGSSTLINGTATYATSALSVGDHSITAVYGGDTNFAGSTSSPVTLTVKAARGAIWGLIAGIIAIGVLVSLFFLLLIFSRRRKPNQQTQK